MLFQWSLLLFILGFSTSIISIHAGIALPPLNYFVAQITYEYIAINDKGEEVPTNRTDNILSVGIEGGAIVGSAQSHCRHINPPVEQIILINEPINYYRIINYKIDVTQVIPRLPEPSCAPLSYGCITLVHNYCSLPFDLATLQFKAVTNAILSSGLPKPETEDSLIAVYLDEKNDLQFAEVNVKDFSECAKQFDPEALYLIDEEEQFCTARINDKFVDSDPAALLGALLFKQDEQNGIKYWYLIGIESKTKGAVSLSTFAPYHCKEFEKKCSA